MTPPHAPRRLSAPRCLPALTPVLPAALLAGLLAAAPAATAQTAPVEEIVIVGRRGGVPAYERPYGPTVLDAASLATAPQRRLDEALRAVPGFGLFRRAGSRLANPTTQGVSLRGIGPNGAGRTLVLVDGVPVNDPFGGWVYWSRLPTGAVERVVVTRGGGAGAWGNAALAGTVRIETTPPEGSAAELSGGSDDTWQALAATAGRAGPVTLGLTANAFTTGGAPVVRRDQRGPVDVNADADALWADGVARARFGNVAATAKLSVFRETRGNGTPYTGNRTEAVEGSLRLVGEGALPWEAVLYARDWEFSSTFSGVDDDRAGETPALDQHKVPATALGGIVQIGLEPAPGHSTDLGIDLRWTDGETRERYFFQNGAFTRERRAGGEQIIAGLFAEHVWTARPGLLLTAGARLDGWWNRGGFRTEVVRETGAPLLDRRLPDRDGRVLNGRAGADWQATDALALRGAVYTGFRLPTLNEFHRPFRVGNDITEANPGLDPERLAGGEVGLRLTPRPGLTLSATLFHVELDDAVDNVVLTRTPGAYAPLGIVVPAGGSLAQRRNLDRIEVDGIEAELRLEPRTDLSLSFSYLFSDAEIVSAPGFPALDGNRVGQAPRHQGTVEAAWRPVEPATLRVQVRAASDAYETSENERRLSPYVVADLYAGWDLSRTLHLFGTVENLTDRLVETGVRSDGLTNIGPGRQWQIGLKARW